MKKHVQLGPIEIVEPREIIYDILNYKKYGSVLDLGAGYGRHALFLASKGFEVTAVEKEIVQVRYLKEQSVKLGVSIKIIQDDISQFFPDKQYDVVLATMVIHFLLEQEAIKVIGTMQNFTAPEGLNVIAVYTDKNPVGLRPYQFAMEELKDMYQGWEIVRCEEFLGQEIESSYVKDGGPSRRYNGVLIAKKVSDL
jgi:tellurite methyltransferase